MHYAQGSFKGTGRWDSAARTISNSSTGDKTIVETLWPAGLCFKGKSLFGHASLLKVGQLFDAYLTEITLDPYLPLHKFIDMVEILPDYAPIMDDGLYRATDNMYMKAHPMLTTENECKKLCKFIDCQKLSQEACNHASQNDRLHVQMTVRVLYF
ncbi:hypothetical protein ACFE04_020892 [Oxalis oulophora]